MMKLLVFLSAILCLLLPACGNGGPIEAESADILTYQGTLNAMDVDGWGYYDREYLVTLTLDDTLVIFHTSHGERIEGLILGQTYQVNVWNEEDLYLRDIVEIGEGT